MTIEREEEYIDPKYIKIDNDCSSEDIDVVNTSNESCGCDNHIDGEGESIIEESVNMEVPNCLEQNSNFSDCTQKESACNYKSECIRKRQSKKLLMNLVEKLDDEGNLNDFMNLIEQLSTGELSANNIVLLLLLDRVRFQKCTTTVGMRYRNVTKLFWSVVYRLCKGVGLKFFGGKKNWGQLVSKQCDKSKYSPQKSKVNFAVPDEKVLREISRVLPKVIPPGKIRSTMELLRDKRDIILMGDAKLVTRGLKSDFCGDVNLFGHENSPNLDDLRNYLDQRIDFISDSVNKFAESSSGDKFNILSDLTDLVTEMVKTVHQYNTSERQKLLRFSNGNYPTKLEKAINACKTNIYTASIWIFKSLKINDDLFKMMAIFQGNKENGQNVKYVDLTKYSNIRLLHKTEYVSSEIDRNEYPHLIKKYSDDWKELVKESIISDECICDSLGLNGTKKLNKYVKDFLKDDHEC